MLRMSDDAFVNDRPNKDTVVAIRIHNGEYYFLGWMEDSENYDMQIANHPERNLLGRVLQPKFALDRLASTYQRESILPRMFGTD